MRLGALDGRQHVGIQLDAAKLGQQIVEGTLGWRAPATCDMCAGR